jgi:drug/metabolite transporter (DMT)-like permease
VTGAQLARLFGVVFIAVTSIVVGDTAGKLLGAQGVDPRFIAWTRFAIACAVLLPLSGLSFGELPNFKDWRVLLRGAMVATGISLILTALKTEPIANVFGAFFVGPIVSYLVAAIFLGERPSLARSFLLAFGFAGVMLVVKPGFGGGVGMLYALGAGTVYGVYLALTRVLAPSYRPRFLLISQLLIGTVILAPFGLSVELPPMTTSISALVVLSAAASAFGNFLLVIASKRAEASLIAPLVYSQLISATFMGIVVFGDWPDTVALIGLLMIGLSGAGSLLASRSSRNRSL